MRMSKAKKHNLVGMIFQKMCGVFMLVFSAWTPYLTDGDVTSWAITIPLGLYLIFTSQAIMYERRRIKKAKRNYGYRRYVA